MRVIFRVRDPSCLLAANCVSFQYDVCLVFITIVVALEPE